MSCKQFRYAELKKIAIKGKQYLKQILRFIKKKQATKFFNDKENLKLKSEKIKKNQPKLFFK